MSLCQTESIKRDILTYVIQIDTLTYSRVAPPIDEDYEIFRSIQQKVKQERIEKKEFPSWTDLYLFLHKIGVRLQGPGVVVPVLRSPIRKTRFEIYSEIYPTFPLLGLLFLFHEENEPISRLDRP